MVFKTLNEQGFLIKIRFNNAEGLVAGKSVIKYKDIEVGLVKDISLSSDLKSIIVSAEIKKNMKEFLSENTRFWILNAHFDATGIRGVSTLLSGSYIVMDPKKGEESVFSFTGLDDVPIIESEKKGKIFYLETENIGSLQRGTPVNYKKLPVGKVISSTLDDKGKKLKIKIFIESPYDKFITTHTRFWDTSGFNVKLDANGVVIKTPSIQSLLVGGISFDTFEEFFKKEKIKKNHIFKLHDSIESARAKEYHLKIKFWSVFEESVRGLSIGAPVEFRGIEIGKVLAFSLEGDMNTQKFTVPVLMEISPERFSVIGEKNTEEEQTKDFQKLLDKGLAAELKTGNLLTGQIFVNLDFFPVNDRDTRIKERDGIVILPTVSRPIDSILNNTANLMDRLSSIPIEEIGKDFHKTVIETKKLIKSVDINNINTIIATLEKIIKDLEQKTVPKLNNTLDTTNNTVDNANNNYLKSNAKLKKELSVLINEVTKTAKSVKSLTDYLQRHPEALIKGK